MGRGEEEEEQGWNSEGSVGKDGSDEVGPCASPSAGSDQKNRPKCYFKLQKMDVHGPAALGGLTWLSRGTGRLRRSETGWVDRTRRTWGRQKQWVEGAGGLRRRQEERIQGARRGLALRAAAASLHGDGGPVAVWDIQNLEKDNGPVIRAFQVKLPGGGEGRPTSC